MMYRLENNIIKTDHVASDEAYAGGVGYFCFNFMKKHASKVAQVIFFIASIGVYNIFRSTLRPKTNVRKKYLPGYKKLSRLGFLRRIFYVSQLIVKTSLIIINKN